MAEYTRKDIIMDPKDSRLENAIGKKVFSSSDINLILQRANDGEYEKTLTQVEDVDSEPFTVVDMDGDELDADFIIIKKEPELEYVPFESTDEFIDAYDSANYSVSTGTMENRLLNYGGTWIKGKISEDYYMVAEIHNNGVVLASDQDIIFWGELLEDYVFLDGTPCGKLMEDK